MATALKVLGQSKPAAATLTDLYTVPAATEAVVSTVVVANHSSSPTTIRISAAPAGAADAAAHYLVRDVTIEGNETISFTLGITLAATDKLRVYNAAATCSFSAFGQENS